MPKVIDNMGKVLAEFPYDASGEMEAQKMVTGNPNLKLVREEAQGGLPISSAADRGDIPAAGGFAGIGDDYTPPKPASIDPIYDDPESAIPGSNAMERNQITYMGGGKVREPRSLRGPRGELYKKGGKVK